MNPKKENMSPKPSDSKVKKHNDFIVYDIGRLYVLLNQYLTAAYQEFGLNPAKFNLLMHIKHIGKEKGISQIELGDKLYVSAANITKLIDGLEKKGWVKRISSSRDRRIKLIKITREGSALLDEVWPRHVEALNALLEGFAPEDKERFNLLLDRFREEMETAGQNE
jgi:MarR family 2-MHQ and catechol resistance regulon transcriptional repressor